MKAFGLPAVTAALFLLALSPALAATASSPDALTIRVGGFVQTDSTAGDAGFAGGIDYALRPASALQPFVVSAYGDILGRSLGAGVSIRNSGPLYIGAGAGFYNTSISPKGGGAASIPPFGSSPLPAYTASGVGGKVYGGFELAPHTTLEIGVHFLPQADQIDSNVFTAEFGIRF
jgi:hypothetical protein